MQPWHASVTMSSCVSCNTQRRPCSLLCFSGRHRLSFSPIASSYCFGGARCVCVSNLESACGKCGSLAAGCWPVGAIHVRGSRLPNCLLWESPWPPFFFRTVGFGPHHHQCLRETRLERLRARAGVHRESSVNQQTYELFHKFAWYGDCNGGHPWSYVQHEMCVRRTRMRSVSYTGDACRARAPLLARSRCVTRSTRHMLRLPSMSKCLSSSSNLLSSWASATVIRAHTRSSSVFEDSMWEVQADETADGSRLSPRSWLC